MEEKEEILRKYLEEEGVVQFISPFCEYLKLLLKWREKFNLTGFRDPETIIVRGFVESLKLKDFISHGSFVMDVGSGAGFPGIPLKIVRDDIRLLLLEPKKKRWSFLKEVIRTLNLKNTTAIEQRVEDETFSAVMRRTIDVITSRAFAQPDKLLFLTGSYLKEGGRIITFSSPEQRISSPPGWEKEEKIYELPPPYGRGKIAIFKKCFT